MKVSGEKGNKPLEKIVETENVFIMKLNNKLGLLAIMMVISAELLLPSCKKNEIEPAMNTDKIVSLADENKEQIDGEMVLGKRLSNPYEISNMQQAYENIKSSFPNSTNPVRITHKYIKLIPSDELQLSQLKQDDNLILYSYPLDYEILKNGTYYRGDVNPEDSTVTPQYATNTANQNVLGSVRMEIQYELYYPEEDKNLSSYLNTSETPAFEEALTLEAFRLKGLDVESNPGNEQGKTTARKWTPAGKIRVWDDYNNLYVGVEGVEVRAVRWGVTHRGLTDANGNFTCDGQFRYNANYALQWDRRHFSIRCGTYGQAVYNGPKQKGNWNLDLNIGSQMFYARIFRAAHQYYYKDIDGLSRPPLNNNMFDPQLKIAAFNKENTDINGDAAPWRRFMGLGNFIRIYNPQNNIREIHGTIIHELGHASHWNLCSPKSNFNSASDLVVESWARGVQWWLTHKLYPTYHPTYWSIYNGNGSPYYNYTGVVEDLIDGKNGYDQVEGYSISQIEQSVINQKKWVVWYNNIKNSYSNATKNNVPALFTHWY